MTAMDGGFCDYASQRQRSRETPYISIPTSVDAQPRHAQSSYLGAQGPVLYIATLWLRGHPRVSNFNAFAVDEGTCVT